MKASQVVWTAIVVVLFLYAEFMFFAPDHYRGSVVEFTANGGDLITIEGVDTVIVSAESNYYFRIYSREQRLLALPDNQDLFTAESEQFPANDWEIKDGSSVKITLRSDNDAWFFVTNQSSTGMIISGTIMCLLIGIVLWIAGYIILE